MPHRRGDEPHYQLIAFEEIFVCPTGVGMNRFSFTVPHRNLRMPHRRGDEPK